MFFVCVCVFWSLPAGSWRNNGSLWFESFHFSATLKACSTAKEASPSFSITHSQWSTASCTTLWYIWYFATGWYSASLSAAAQSSLRLVTAERQLVTAAKVERWENPNEVFFFLLMRLALILSALSQLQQDYRYAPRPASSQWHSSSKAAASNTAIQLKHCSNTTGVPAVNFSLVPPERITIHEYQNAWLKT